MPIPIGSSFAFRWWMLAGMIARPSATSRRTNSASRPSRSATRRISGVTSPSRARCIWVTFLAMMFPREWRRLDRDDLPDLWNRRLELVLDAHLQRHRARGAALARALEPDMNDAVLLVHVHQLDVPAIELDVRTDPVKDFVHATIEIRDRRERRLGINRLLFVAHALSSLSVQVWNELPQPHELFTFGFLIWKPDPMRPSLYS